MLKIFRHCRKWVLCFSLMLCLCSVVVPSMVVHASSIEDNVNGGNSGGGMSIGDLPSKDQDRINIFGNLDMGPSANDLAKASNTLSPLTNIIGTIVGGIMVLTFAAVFAITALDVFCITFPPIRHILYKGGAEAGGAGGGYVGMRGGIMGGMQSGGGAGAKPVQWISDEAIQCIAMLEGGQGQSAGGGMIGGGYGGYGMGMGGTQGQGADQNMSKKSVIGMYFKKRMLFMIILAITATVLTSSILMKTGVNLGAWVLKIFNMLNNNIPM